MNLFCFWRSNLIRERRGGIWMEWNQDKGVFDILGNWSESGSCAHRFLRLDRIAQRDFFNIPMVVRWEDDPVEPVGRSWEWFRRGISGVEHTPAQSSQISQVD